MSGGPAVFAQASYCSNLETALKESTGQTMYNDITKFIEDIYSTMAWYSGSTTFATKFTPLDMRATF